MKTSSFLFLSLVSVMLLSSCSKTEKAAEVEDPSAKAPEIEEGSSDVLDLNMENALKELDLVE